MTISIPDTFSTDIPIQLRFSENDIEICVLYQFWQLGLAEKNILNCDFDLVASDPSDANTNSTTLFSDDTEDKLRRSTNPETGMSIQQEHEVSGNNRILK